MRRALRTAAATLAVALSLAAPAGAEVVGFAGGASAGGHELIWEAQHDDVARTVVLTATHTQIGGLPQLGLPLRADIFVELNNGQPREFDLLTTVAPSDGQPGLINKGPQTFTNVNLKVAQDRGRVISFTTEYVPPAAG